MTLDTALRALLVVVLLGAESADAGTTDRVQQYLGLARATLERPITPAELEAAVLSPAGIEDISALFQRSLASSLTVDGSPVTPELGGEATLDRGRLRFVEYPDLLHPVVRRMVELKDDPRAVLDFLSRSLAGQQLLKTTGGLHALLFQMTSSPGPDEARRRALDRVLASAVSIHFKTWRVDPEQQLAMIRQNDWRGRYVGFWHIHPPNWTGQGYAPGLEPSQEDMTVAVEKGQFLTIVFQPDGFDLYDLSPLAEASAPVLSKSRVIRHRSVDWTRRFAKDRRSTRLRLRSGLLPPFVRRNVVGLVPRLVEPFGQHRLPFGLLEADVPEAHLDGHADDGRAPVTARRHALL